jgi:CheY-like chemotaxis protein
MTDPLRILIVEDEAVLLMQLEAIFEDEGHIVVGTAMTAAEAIAVAEATTPDIAIVDIHLLDGSSGIDVARHLRESGETLVVFVTANAKRVPEDYEGAVGLISKPYSQAGMAAAIKYLNEFLRSPPPQAGLPTEFKLAPAYLEHLQALNQRSRSP